MADYRVSAFYTVEGVGKTGITVTVDVYRANGTKVVSDGNATAIGGGLFGYTHSDATESDYFAVFKTSDATVDAKQIPAMMSREQANITVIDGLADAIKAKTDNLPSSPAAVGSQMTLADGAVTADKIASNAITADKIASSAITDAKIATDAISAAKFKADAVTKIQNGLATPTNITSATGVKLDPVQGGVHFTDQVKITADVEEEGALHIVNENGDGIGQYNEGGGVGQQNIATIAAYGAGQQNIANMSSGVGQQNMATHATGTAQQNIGGSKPVDGYDPAIKTGLALEATLSAMKGAGWTDETLVAILEAIEAIDGGGGGSTPAEIWSHATRTLTASPTDISGLATEANATTNKNTIVTAITNKPVTPATDISGLATEANATTNKNTIVTAINNKPVTPVTDTSALAKSSELTPLAKSSELTSLAKTSDLTGLAEKTDIPVDYAKELTLQDVKDQTDQLTFTVPGSVDATAVVDTSALATSAELELVADNVSEIKGKTDQLVFTVPGKVDTDAKIDVSELIDSLLEANIEGGLDLKGALRVVLAFASGVSEGGGSTTIKYKDLTGLADRIIWTVNKSGDRLTSNIDGSDVT